MNTQSSNGDEDLPLGLVRQLDALCDEFEQQLVLDNTVGFAQFIDRIEMRARQRLVQELAALAADHLRDRGVSDPAPVIEAHNPGLEVEIAAALANLSKASPARSKPPGGRQSTTKPLTPRGKRSRGLRIRCPHCSNHVELVVDASLDSVNCSVCGSTFSLVDRSKETRLAEALHRIDRFELISRVGVGGFGTVWKARDVDLQRTVAVKIPRHGQLSPAEVGQFLREARSVAQLRHPNIVPVHEVGREEDVIFIVSDLVRGVSLADLLTSDRLAPREAARLCATMAEALDHAHANGVIHRDLKPSNIMIDDDGTPYLMDFGLAKREAEEVTMTTDGQIIGTPAYMSPEQARGDNAWTDRRTDVYSLGVILFELLTGELPFRGNAQMQVHRRLHRDAPSVLSLNRHLPKDLATICEKCLERDPGRRYQTAGEVADELRRYLDRIPIRARPTSRLHRTLRWAARKPLPATLVALLFFLAIAGPTTAIVIMRKNAELRAAAAEQANLIKMRERESREAVTRAAQLQDRLDLWEGRANPWALWPPDPAEPPKTRQLASLLAARGDELEQPREGEVELEKAQRLHALATLYESVNRRDDAERTLLAAVNVLRSLRQARPRELPLALTLAEVYERLSALKSVADSAAAKQWLDDARELRRELAQEYPGNPLLQAHLADAELRSSAAAGFESAHQQLATAQKLDGQLTHLWPKSPSEIYRLAALLAGRQPWLANQPSTDGDASTAPSR